MKIDKFNESADDYLTKNEYFNKKFPFKCKIKNRTPDPGICWIIEINFEDEEIEWSNGYVRSTVYGFDNVEFIPDLFLLNKYNL